MEEVEACEFAFDRFLKQNDCFLHLCNEGKPDIACEMILLEVCAAMILLEDDSREQFFLDIVKMKENISREIFEDESDFLDCINGVMEKIREN